MANKFGPTRGELLFRAAFSVFGLLGIALLLAVRGLPNGPGLVEVFGIALVFFAGSLGHAIWRLWRPVDQERG